MIAPVGFFRGVRCAPWWRTLPGAGARPHAPADTPQPGRAAVAAGTARRGAADVPAGRAVGHDPGWVRATGLIAQDSQGFQPRVGGLARNSPRRSTAGSRIGSRSTSSLFTPWTCGSSLAERGKPMLGPRRMQRAGPRSRGPLKLVVWQICPGRCACQLCGAVWSLSGEPNASR